MTCEEIARESGIPKSSVHRIVTENSQKRKVSVGSAYRPVCEGCYGGLQAGSTPSPGLQSGYESTRL
jgi:predicted transcriptional regulator